MIITATMMIEIVNDYASANPAVEVNFIGRVIELPQSSIEHSSQAACSKRMLVYYTWATIERRWI